MKLLVLLTLCIVQDGAHLCSNTTYSHEDFQTQWSKELVATQEHYSTGKVLDYSNNPTNKLEGHNQQPVVEPHELRRLCFCVHSEPLCELQEVPLTVSPGESVALSLVALDQHNLSVSTTLYTRFTADINQNQRFLNREAHIVQPGCKNITFKISSANSKETLTLSSYPISSSLNSLTLDITFRPCPRGFTLLPSSPKCQCSEYFQWIDGVKCSSEDHMVERKGNSWLEYSCSGAKQALCGLKYHDNCPYHYCNQSIEHVDLSVSNSVCTGNRAGILCGGCAENYSTIIGGSDCWDCRNVSTTRTKTLILGFVIAGLLLVTITISLDLRISRGRLNGLIFYGAVINLNRNTFFSTNSTLGNVLRLFFAWLNLDLGFSVCSSGGLEQVSELWLQFAFPAYIIILILIVSIAFQFSITLSNQSAGALPSCITLFLLAYLKILRTTISTLPFARVRMYPYDSETMVWLYDGNVGYFDSEHMKLFTVSVLFLFFAALYTLVLLSSHSIIQLDVLDAKSSLNLSHILDAYSGRTKPISKFWFGLLLLFHTFQVTIYHFTGGDAIINLVVAIMCACLLLSFNLILDGPYKDTFINKLEQFFFLNMIAVSALHIYFQDRQSNFSTCSDLLIMAAAIINLLWSISERCFKYYSKLQFYKRFRKYVYINHDQQTSVSPVSESTVRVADMATDSESDWERDNSVGSNASSDNVFRDREEATKFFDPSPEAKEIQDNQDKTNEEPHKTISSSILRFEKTGEAILVSDKHNIVEQTVGTDRDGVSTMNYNYVEKISSHSTPTVDSPAPAMRDKAATLPCRDQVATTPILRISRRKVLTRKSRTRSQTFYSKHLTQTKRRGDHFSSVPKISSVLSTCLPGHYPITVFDVSSTGGTFTDHGVVVDIPPGAICNQRRKVKFEIGILAHGPFECSTSTTRMSPVLWFCCTDYVRFEKSIQITLPHCLRRVSTVGNDGLGLCFMKANYLLDVIDSVVKLKSFDQTECAKFSENKGTLQIKLALPQDCFFCIAANQGASLFVEKAEYCLTRIDSKPWTQDTTVYFCVSHFLETCLEDIQKQFPPERFEIKSRTCFQFRSDCKNCPKIGIDVASCNGWLLAVEHPGRREIFASEVHFSHENDPAFKLKREYGIYPPRFQLRVCGTHAYAPTTVDVSFTGIVPRVDSPLLLTIDTPTQPVSFGVGTVPHMPEACFKDVPKYGLDSYHDPSNFRPKPRGFSLPPRRRERSLHSDYSADFNNIVSDLGRLEGLDYPIRWPQLQDYIVQMAPMWKQIGTYLIVQFQLEIIEQDHHSCVDRVTAVLRVWEKSAGQGLEFHWSVLIAALQCVGEGNLVLDLKQHCRQTSTRPYDDAY